MEEEERGNPSLTALIRIQSLDRNDFVSDPRINVKRPENRFRLRITDNERKRTKEILDCATNGMCLGAHGLKTFQTTKMRWFYFLADCGSDANAREY